jgi:peptidoglycan/LPS O-acetylase OafA/YrhL
VTAVFAYHAFAFHPTYGRLAFVRYGNLGVEAFFVLSGFLITLRLLDLVARSDLTAGGRYRAFMVRRAARILPLYYATLAIIATLGPALGFAIERGAWPWYLLYAMNVFVFARGSWAGAGGHFWSLCVEEQFYLVYPALVLTRARRWLLPVVGLLAALSAAARAACALASGRAADAWLLAPLHFDALGAGIVAGVLVGRGNVYGRNAARALVLGGALSFVVFLTVAVAARPSALTVGLLPTALALATAALLVILWRREAPVLGAILGSRLVAGLGRISYGFYVFHLFVVVYLFDPALRWLPPVALVRGAVAFVLSTALAAVSFYAFEMPILARGRRATERP